MAWPAIIAAVAQAAGQMQAAKEKKEDRRAAEIEAAKGRRDKAYSSQMDASRHVGQAQSSALMNLINALQRAAQR